MIKIKNYMSLIILAVALAFPFLFSSAAHSAEWKGVDETVVEKFAEEAGRPSREPFINTDQGDILLFMFLLAGAVGGFAAGYFFRALFPPKNAVREK